MTFMVHAMKDADRKVEIRGTAYMALMLARRYERTGHDVVIETLDKQRFGTDEFIKSLVLKSPDRPIDG